jgi:hypothetical protein
MSSYLSPEQRVRKDHPLRAVRAMTDEILERMSPLFDAMYAEGGRPSIAPEKLLRAHLLQMLYSVRSERLPMEEIDYSILYRWFVGLNLDDQVWDATTFTKNRERLLEAAGADAKADSDSSRRPIEPRCLCGRNKRMQGGQTTRFERQNHQELPTKRESVACNTVFQQPARSIRAL